MNIFVGTLYSNENEFEDCLGSIESQTYKKYQHFIYKNLPNKEAHRVLFSNFLDKRDIFDIMIKIDADMVLTSDCLFENIVTKMKQCSELEVFSIAVQDFFSGKLINGLNTYRNSVQWNFTKDTMFVDIPEVSPEKQVFDKTILAPAAIHCKNPSPFQAFHYGVHRGLKSLQKKHSTTHWALLENTWKNFILVKDPRIGLAIIGAELVYGGKFTKKDVDYTNPNLHSVIEPYLSMNYNEIKHEITLLRIMNFGFLPGNLRRKLLRSIRNQF